MRGGGVVVFKITLFQQPLSHFLTKMTAPLTQGSRFIYFNIKCFTQESRLLQGFFTFCFLKMPNSLLKLLLLRRHLQPVYAFYRACRSR